VRLLELYQKNSVTRTEEGDNKGGWLEITEESDQSPEPEERRGGEASSKKRKIEHRARPPWSAGAGASPPPRRKRSRSLDTAARTPGTPPAPLRPQTRPSERNLQRMVVDFFTFHWSSVVASTTRPAPGRPSSSILPMIQLPILYLGQTGKLLKKTR